MIWILDYLTNLTVGAAPPPPWPSPSGSQDPTSIAPFAPVPSFGSFGITARYFVPIAERLTQAAAVVLAVQPLSKPVDLRQAAVESAPLF
ncbi:MAG: hypothetical protein Q8P62_04090 [Candidatus Peregrinibacteria bacterium]|nr:hypothetical protein [Candidatus Peregrinibacteria bacterium]